MNNIKIGDKLTIHCYKHSGLLYQTSSEATVIDITEDMLVCANQNTKITELDKRSYKTKEPAVLIFYKKRWYNVLGQLKKHGLFYYCNIATPFLIDDNIIKYIDYDLDLRVFPDGGFRILDRNEYAYHKKLMNYPDEIDMIVKRELNELIELKRKNEGPFQEGLIEKYYEKYKDMMK